MVQFEIINLRKYGGDGYIIDYVGKIHIKVLKKVENYLYYGRDKHPIIYDSMEEAEKALEEIKKIVEKAL